MQNDSYMEALRVLQDAMKCNIEWKDSTTRALSELSNITKVYSNMSGIESMISALQKSLQFDYMKIIEATHLNTELLSPVVAANTQLLSSAIASFQTPEISKLVNGLANNYYIDAMKTFSECLKSPQIAAANLALIRMNPSLAGTVEDWNGMQKFVSKIKLPTAKVLMENEKIIVDSSEKVYRYAVDDNCETECDEMNVLASALSVFDGIEVTELMELNNRLASGMELALKDPTAIKIYNIIHEWKDFISFDRDIFYRARILDEGQAPFTVMNFGTVPEQFVGYGRYNHDGQSHYYVASTEKGACTEIRKHSKGITLQVASLKPKKSVRLIDLSQKTESSSFLKYLRFEADKKERVPRAYLLPCFVTTCCKDTVIEGIKYYGSQEYDNYVTWNNSYYSIESVSEPM